MSESTKADQPSANSSCGYHCLPGELRNLIYKQILVRGAVWIRPPPSSKRTTLHISDKICLWLVFWLDIFAQWLYKLIRKMSDSTVFAGWLEPHVSIHNQPVSGKIKKKPCGAYQFLATYKQAHDEGSALFYSQNRFHLPPGPVEIMETWIEGLQPKDKAMLDELVLDISLLDLEPYVVDIIYIKAILKSFVPFSRSMPEIWTDDIENHLLELWTKKVEFLERWQETTGGTGNVSRHEVLRGCRSVRRGICSRLRIRGFQYTRKSLIQRDHWVIGSTYYKLRL